MREEDKVRSEWNDATKAANRVQWMRLSDGLAPLNQISVDCAASDAGNGEPCYFKPVWVLEDYYGYHPTCLAHMGKVSLDIASQYQASDSDFAVYYLRYKGV